MNLDKLQILKARPKAELNNSYFPVVFESNEVRESVFTALAREDVHPRRYFYPSLNTLPYLETNEPMPISEDISERIACLPLYHDLAEEDIIRISKIINDTI